MFLGSSNRMSESYDAWPGFVVASIDRMQTNDLELHGCWGIGASVKSVYLAIAERCTRLYPRRLIQCGEGHFMHAARVLKVTCDSSAAHYFRGLTIHKGRETRQVWRLVFCRTTMLIHGNSRQRPNSNSNGSAYSLLRVYTTNQSRSSRNNRLYFAF